MIFFCLIAIINICVGFGLAVYLGLGPRPWYALFTLNDISRTVIQISAIDEPELGQSPSKDTTIIEDREPDFEDEFAEEEIAEEVTEPEEVEEPAEAASLDPNSLKDALAVLEDTKEPEEGNEKVDAGDIDSLFDELAKKPATPEVSEETKEPVAEATDSVDEEDEVCEIEQLLKEIEEMKNSRKQARREQAASS